jgi:hypothetical protein
MQPIQPSRKADQMEAKVPATTDKSEPDPFAAIAAELRKAADGIETLVGSGLPKPNLVSLSIQPGGRGDDDLIVRAVDAMATVLLDGPGEILPYPGDVYHYGTPMTWRGPVQVSVYNRVSTEWALKRDAAAALAAKEAELNKLRAEVAVTITGPDYRDRIDAPQNPS